MSYLFTHYVSTGASSWQQAASGSQGADGRGQHPLRSGGERGCHLDVHGDHKTMSAAVHLTPFIQVDDLTPHMCHVSFSSSGL